MVTKIPLSRGLHALVDDEDAALVNQYKWYAKKMGGSHYAMRKAPRNGGKQNTIYMHSFLTGFNITDHINGEGLDNRRTNLREVTYAQNGHNRRKSKESTSQFKGVYLKKKCNKYVSTITAPQEGGGSGYQEYLGLFANESDAARAYDAAAREYHGEYAALNFPLPGERSALTGEIVPLVAEENAQEVAA